MQEIRGDTELSAEGHAKKIKETARAALKKIDELHDRTLKVIQEQLATLKAEFSWDPPADESVTSTLREIEVRGHLLALDTSKRNEVLQSAVATKDEILFRAFTNAPPFLCILNAKIIEHARQEWAERVDPRKAKELKQVGEVVAILTESFAETYQAVGELGQIIDDSTRARLQRLAQTGLDTAAARYGQHRLAVETTDTAGNKLEKPATKIVNA